MAMSALNYPYCSVWRYGGGKGDFLVVQSDILCFLETFEKWAISLYLWVEKSTFSNLVLKRMSSSTSDHKDSKKCIVCHISDVSLWSTEVKRPTCT